MNIIVKPYGSNLCYCRPDTTWERENKDFYSPDCINEIYWTPIIFARICKAGKCIGEKFVERYYDAVGFGVLLYCRAGDKFVECADHTSRLPHPLFSPIVLNQENTFTVYEQSSEIFGCNAGDLEDTLRKAVCNASQLTSLRIGDFVAAELDSPKPLTDREKGNIAVKGQFGEHIVFDFGIIL